MTDVQDKPKRERKPKAADSEPSTYTAGEPAVVPVFALGDRVNYWMSIQDDNLEAHPGDVLKVFAGINGEPTQYWVNVQWPGQLECQQGVKASLVPKHHTITARE